MPDLDRSPALDAARRRLVKTTREHFARPLDSPDGAGACGKPGVFRSGLRDALRADEGTSPRLIVARVDLDGFEPFDAARRRAVVDGVLGTFVERLARRARGGIERVGRCNGNEFACVLDGPGEPERASGIARDLYEALSAPCEVAGVQLSVRPCIGVACSPGDGTSAGNLLMYADAALQRARHYGTGYALYTGELDAAFTSPGWCGDAMPI